MYWNAPDNLDDTWQYNLNTNTWTNMSPPVSPPARFGQVMTYDNKAGVVILFGGGMLTCTTGQHVWPILFNDTWIYNVSENNWTNMDPEISPPARIWSEMAYDSTYDVHVLFSGEHDSYPWDKPDTWTYNSSQNTWTEVNCTQSPPGRCNYAMAFNSREERVFIFGGEPDPGVALYNDTWEFDFENKTWNQLNLVTQPTVRTGHSMVYDSANDAIILYGGWASCTWAYGCNG